MKILIATMTCGQGHNAIAKSIKDGFGEDDEVKIVNIYEHLGKKRDKYGKAYLFSVKYIPKSFTFVWNILRRRNPERRYRGGAMGGIKCATDEMERIVNEFKPDAVICTHVSASNIFCWLKIHNRFHTKLYTVFFDYVACPFWEGSVLCDGVFTPHELTHKELLLKGYREEQLIQTGFPVNPKFDNEMTKEQARAQIGLERDDYVVLSVNGGAGVGNAKGFVKQLLRVKTDDKKLSALIVCGNNKKAQKNLTRMLQKRNVDFIKVYGFIDNMDVMLSATDLFFCRGGGGAVSESLVKNVPFVVRERAVAQEEGNGKVFSQLGVCKTMRRVSDARRIIERDLKGGGIFDMQRLVTLQQTGSVKRIVRYIREH